MPIVPLSQIEPGVTLARSVEDSMGRVLINAGEQLTPALIAVLVKRGFVEVEIRPNVKPRETEALEERADRKLTDIVRQDTDVLRIKKDVEERFHNVPETNRNMQVVRVMCQKALVDRVVKKKGLG